MFGNKKSDAEFEFAQDTFRVYYNSKVNRDDFIYRFIKMDCEDDSILEFKQVGREECLELFNEYAETKKELY